MLNESMTFSQLTQGNWGQESHPLPHTHNSSRTHCSHLRGMWASRRVGLGFPCCFTWPGDHRWALLRTIKGLGHRFPSRPPAPCQAPGTFTISDGVMSRGCAHGVSQMEPDRSFLLLSQQWSLLVAQEDRQTPSALGPLSAAPHASSSAPFLNLENRSKF